jgi:2-deoxy-D-gluconate 3-dehydrogenase
MAIEVGVDAAGDGAGAGNAERHQIPMKGHEVGEGSLTGRRAVVTGGAGGIGSAIVRAFHHEGADVVAIGRSRSVEELATGKGAEGARVSGVVADLSDRDQLEEGFARALEVLGGGLDILLTAHGHVVPHDAATAELDDWDLTIETNLRSIFRLSQLSFDAMAEGGDGNRKIIHIASMYAFLGGLRVAAYAASKGGVAQLTKSLALEWAPHSINVNAIAPGYIRTELNRHMWGEPERYSQVLSRIPAGRWGDPDDLTGTAVFLASPASDYIHGIILPVDGGDLAR